MTEVVGALTAPQTSSKRVSSNAVIAVLPILNVTGDAANDFITIGVADVLASHLGKLRGWSVVPRASTMSYRQLDRDLNRIGKYLGATLVVDGSLQRAGDRLRFTINLIDTESGQLKWSDQIDCALDEVFGVQSRISTNLASRLSDDGAGQGEPLYHRNVGDTLLKMEDRNGARLSYEKAADLTEGMLRINPNDPDHTSRLAVYEAKLGKADQALDE
jgi:TolB-like protein